MYEVTLMGKFKAVLFVILIFGLPMIPFFIVMRKIIPGDSFLPKTADEKKKLVEVTDE